MALATPQLLKYFDTWTGGQQGINLVKPMPPAGLGIDRDRWLYLVVLFVLIVAIRVAANLLHGRTGRAFIAIRDQPIAAAAMGIDTARYKTLAFGTSTLFTGVAGALAAIVVGYVSPEGYSIFLSISFLVGSAIGGIATIGGAIVGGFFIQFVPNLANDISDAAPWAIYGLAMLAFMYAMPNGVAGSLKPLIARVDASMLGGTLAASAATRSKKSGGCHDDADGSCGEAFRRPASCVDGALLLPPANTARAPATPRSRSATPCPIAARPRPMAPSASRKPPTSP